MAIGQHGKLCRGQMIRAFGGLRPDKAAALQAPAEEAEAIAVPLEQLDQITVPVTQDDEMIRDWIGGEFLLNDSG